MLKGKKFNAFALLIPQTNRYVIYKHKIYLFQTYYLQRINRISY